MGKALGQLWTAFSTLFGAFNVLAMAINHLCVWGERTAKSFAEEAEEDRLIKAQERKLLMGITDTPAIENAVVKVPKAKAAQVVAA